MIRNLLCLLLSFSLVGAMASEARALADPPQMATTAPETQTPFSHAHDVSGVGKAYFGAETDLDLKDAWNAGGDKSLEEVKDAARQAAKNGAAEVALDHMGKALASAEVAWHLAHGEWLEAAKTAVVEAADWGSDLLLKARYGAMVAEMCAGLMIGAGVCFVGVMIVAGLAKSKLLEAAGDKVLAWGRRRYACHVRPDTQRCDMAPEDVGAAQTAGLDAAPSTPGPGDRVASAPPPNGKTSRSSASGQPPAGAASQGRSASASNGGAIDVSARDIVTTATGAATAQTDIGARGGGGGRLSVSVGDVVTSAAGRDAKTIIGEGAGTVSVGGTVYNQGGSLVIGANKTTRDGRTCLEFFLRTCIVQIYYRKHYSEPCAPGFWMDLRRCLLPADTLHSVGR